MLSAVETDLNALFTDCKCIRLHSVYQLLSGIKKYEDKGVNVWSEQRSTGLKSVLPISCHFYWHNGQKFLAEVLFVKSLFQPVQVFCLIKTFLSNPPISCPEKLNEMKKLDEK